MFEGVRHFHFILYPNEFMKTANISLFQEKPIRKAFHNDEWWFVTEDVVLALTDSSDPKQYIQRMKLRDPELAKGWVQIAHTLSIQTAGGSQKMNCSNTEGIFRIIQSIQGKETSLSQNVTN
jgi:prophage antirepressor-like protein